MQTQSIERWRKDGRRRERVQCGWNPSPKKKGDIFHSRHTFNERKRAARTEERPEECAPATVYSASLASVMVATAKTHTNKNLKMLKKTRRRRSRWKHKKSKKQTSSAFPLASSLTRETSWHDLPYVCLCVCVCETHEWHLVNYIFTSIFFPLSMCLYSLLFFLCVCDWLCVSCVCRTHDGSCTDTDTDELSHDGTEPSVEKCG